MSGSAVASLTAARDAFVPESLPSGLVSPEAVGAGSVRWQRARLVLDQHQRGADAGPVGRVLPVCAELADLLPQRGLRRGSTVVVRGSTTVLLALLAEATADGSWAGVVGMPDLGLLAAAELGIEVSRLALVPKPGAEFGRVVAALLDGLDLVVVAGRASLDGAAGTLARRLSARARNRESVLLSFGAWPGADLELDCAESSWAGLGDGHGHLVERALTVTVRGRGAATRPVQGRLTLPAGPTHRPGSHRPIQVTPQSRPGDATPAYADPAAFTARLHESESRERELAASGNPPTDPSNRTHLHLATLDSPAETTENHKPTDAASPEPAHGAQLATPTEPAERGGLAAVASSRTVEPPPGAQLATPTEPAERGGLAAVASSRTVEPTADAQVVSPAGSPGRGRFVAAASPPMVEPAAGAPVASPAGPPEGGSTAVSASSPTTTVAASTAGGSFADIGLSRAAAPEADVSVASSAEAPGRGALGLAPASRGSGSFADVALSRTATPAPGPAAGDPDPDTDDLDPDWFEPVDGPFLHVVAVGR